MPDVLTPVESPIPDALAWKVKRDNERAERYEITIRGPWDAEPDKMQWVDPDTDLDCLIVRNHFGNLCGYVGVPREHPMYGKSYSECLENCGDEYCYEHSLSAKVSVHGGLTYGDTCQSEGDEPSGGICHVPAPGRPHDVFWHGFDCGHAFDFAPGMHSMEMEYMPDLLRKYGKTKYDHEAAMASKEWSTEKYRTIEYVIDEVRDLAKQLAALRG